MADMKKRASQESIYAMWHDPSTYDPMHMGPPYLPGREVRTVQPKMASDSTLVRELLASEKAAMGAEEELLMQRLNTSDPMLGLSGLLAFLRMLSFIHWTHHWQTRGGSFYGDHELFDRLYKETVPMIDALAERIVGMGSSQLVSPIVQSELVHSFVGSIYEGSPENPNADELVSISLKGVLRFLLFLRGVYELLERADMLSHGTDNLLQDIADKHESFAYLLGQRNSTKLSYMRESKNWKI